MTANERENRTPFEGGRTMNENAQKWVEALRSGKFQQGVGALRTDDRYCCLGVACELFRREFGNASWHRADALDGVTVFVTGEYDTAGELPPPVQNWLGLVDASGGYAVAGYVEESLASDNDNGATFAQIADTIESQPRGLFALVGKAGR